MQPLLIKLAAVNIQVRSVHFLPVRRDAQVFVEETTQKFRVLLVVSAADLSNTVKGAECTGVSLSSEHHHLVRVDVHSYILVNRKQAYTTEVSPHWMNL